MKMYNSDGSKQEILHPASGSELEFSTYIVRIRCDHRFFGHLKWFGISFHADVIIIISGGPKQESFTRLLAGYLYWELWCHTLVLY